MVTSRHLFAEVRRISMPLSGVGITRSICLWHIWLLQKSSNIFIIIFMQLSIFTLWSPGSYGDQTRRQILPNSTPIFIPSNSQIVTSVIQHNGVGIVPVSNPYWGSVNESWGALEQYREKLVIAGSHILPLDHVQSSKKKNMYEIRYAEYFLILKHIIRAESSSIQLILVMSSMKARAQ